MGCSTSSSRADEERAGQRVREALILDSKNLRVKLVLLGAQSPTVLYKRVHVVKISTFNRDVAAHSHTVLPRLISLGGRLPPVIAGDSGVGKSCIVLRFVRGSFDPKSKVTVGAAFLAQTVALSDGRTVKFEIWDTAGQERYASLAPLYYRGASAACVVFDITNADSFRKAHSWVKELQKHAGPRTIIALVGNKSDMSEQREVTREDAEAFSEANGLALYLETSAKTADKVNDLFSAIAAKLPQEGPLLAAGGTPGGGGIGASSPQAT